MYWRLSTMEALAFRAFAGGMTSIDTPTRPVLVTGGTGKTGRRVADYVREAAATGVWVA